MTISIPAAVYRDAIVAGLALLATSHPAWTVVAAVPSPSVGAAGFTLTSTAVVLPDSNRSFPDGPGVDVMQHNCTACHSVGMVMNQPKLSAAAWAAEVNKMRVVYKAPIDTADVPIIVDYLARITRSQ